MAVSQNGNLYVKFRRESKQGILAGIKDYDGDGKYDSLIKFGKYHKPQRGSYSTGARIHNGYLYYSNHLTVYRVKLDNNQIVPKSDPEIIVIDDHEHGSHEHIAKPIAFDDDGIYMSLLVHLITLVKNQKNSSNPRAISMSRFNSSWWYLEI